MNINVTVSKTSDGLRDYVQLISDDAVTVNVVLVADRVSVRDSRPAERDLLEEALDKVAPRRRR